MSEKFELNGGGLSFTKEVPQNNGIQFLDISLTFQKNHVCWQYSPRSSKPLLNFSSKHSKVVKNGIAMSCLKSALTKSCEHKMSDSFNAQVTRLLDVGYPRDAVATVAERLKKSIVLSPSMVAESDRKKRVVGIPYIHCVSHRLKKVGSRYGVNVVFTAANKLGKICAAVQRKNERVKDKKRTDICFVKHTNKFTDCRTSVVYKVPFSCGRFYVGQTGRCINQRLLEHKRSLTGGSPSNLSLHCRDCKCTPKFDECAVLYRHRNEETRLMIEAWHIENSGSACVSQPSINLHKDEIKCLNSYLPRRPPRVPD